jgi:hypothetical protein
LRQACCSREHRWRATHGGGAERWRQLGALGDLRVEGRARCEAAVFLESETETTYDLPTSKKTDLEVMMGTHEIGVSVRRPFEGSFGSGPTQRRFGHR